MTLDQIAQLLTALGDTEAEVAETLRRGGWRGLRKDSCSCPVARYLDHHGVSLGLHEDQAVVDGDRLRIHRPLDAHDDWLDLPVYVALFISSFDSGAYPELLMRGAE